MDSSNLENQLEDAEQSDTILTHSDRTPGNENALPGQEETVKDNASTVQKDTAEDDIYCSPIAHHEVVVNAEPQQNNQPMKRLF